jgi:penicillin-binding protein 1A
MLSRSLLSRFRRLRARWLRIERAYLECEDRLDDRIAALAPRLFGRRGASVGTRPQPAFLRRAADLYLAAENRLDRILRPALGVAGGVARTYDAALQRLRPRGVVRLGVEILGGGATLAAAGAVLLLALAQPAFRETEGDWLKRLQLSVTFLDRDGREIGRRGIRHDDTATLDTIPPVLVEAVLATEDRRFYDHHGIDPVGLARALTANAQASGIVQGGSTLTQQLAKNLFLTNERSLERKIKEAFLAIWLETHFSKRQVLQLYLERAYMGAGTFGVAAASEFYFGKPVREIDLAEAAMLAGLFKAPTRFAPHVNLAAAQGRAGDVLTNMVEVGAVTPSEAAMARAHPAVPVGRDPTPTADYFLDWAFGEVTRLAAAGQFGPDTVLTVRTPLDPAIQHDAERSLVSLLEREGERYGVEQAAMVVMEPEGGVRAMVGGRDYGDSQFNRATEAKRQPGSAFKPFVYASALAFADYRPDSVVSDSGICIGHWCPQNYGRSYAGAVPLWQALAKSINTIPVKLSIGIGRAMLDPTHRYNARELSVGNLAQRGRGRIVDLAHRMGLRTPLPDSASLPIGAAEVTVLDMTAAYAVFANGGRTAPPYAALEIRNSRGALLYARERGGPRRLGVLSERVVADMNSMLAKVPELGTGRRAALPGLRSAGKTGTTNGYRDAWYVGFTGDLVAGVWFGNDDHSTMRQLTGGALPAMAWGAVIGPAEKRVEAKPIPGLGPAPASVGAGLVVLTPAVLAGSGTRGFTTVSGPRGRFGAF